MTSRRRHSLRPFRRRTAAERARAGAFRRNTGEDIYNAHYTGRHYRQ
jgi:hypothetical protein